MNAPPAVAHGDPKAGPLTAYFDRCRTPKCGRAPWLGTGYCMACYNQNREGCHNMGLKDLTPERLREVVESADSWGQASAILGVPAGPLSVRCRTLKIYLGGKEPAEKPPRKERAKKPKKAPAVTMTQAPAAKTAPQPKAPEEPPPEAQIAAIGPAHAAPDLVPLDGLLDADGRDEMLYLLATVGKGQGERPSAVGARLLRRLSDGVLDRFAGKGSA